MGNPFKVFAKVPWKKLGPIARVGMKAAEWLPAASPAIKAIKIAVSLAQKTREVEADAPALSGPEKKADVLATVPPGPVREAAAEFVDAYVAVLNLVAAAKVAVRRLRACVRLLRDAIATIKSTSV